MISYSQTSLNEVSVFLDKRYTGDIKPVKGGYAYFPRGCSVSGETYLSIISVKKSLDND